MVARLQTEVVGSLSKLVIVDVPFTSAFSVTTMVSAYTVSPSGCTLTEAIPAMESDITNVGAGRSVLVVVDKE